MCTHIEANKTPARSALKPQISYDQGLLGGILSGERFQEVMGHPDPTMEGLLAAIYCLGCALGAGVAFVLGDRMGRVGTLRWANVIGKLPSLSHGIVGLPTLQSSSAVLYKPLVSLTGRCSTLG